MKTMARIFVMTNVTQQRMCPITSPFVASNYYVTKRSFNHEKNHLSASGRRMDGGLRSVFVRLLPQRGITIAVPNDTTNEARPCCCYRKTDTSP